MPIYDYTCQEEECKHEFELVLPMKERNSTVKCPKCGKSTLRIPSVNAKMRQNWSQWNAI